MWAWWRTPQGTSWHEKTWCCCRCLRSSWTPGVSHPLGPRQQREQRPNTFLHRSASIICCCWSPATVHNNKDKCSLFNSLSTLFASMFCLDAFWSPRGWFKPPKKYHISVAMNLSVKLPTLRRLAHNEKDTQHFCWNCSWEMETCPSNWRNGRFSVSSILGNEPEPGAIDQDRQSSRYSPGLVVSFSAALAWRWRGCEWRFSPLYRVPASTRHHANCVRTLFFFFKVAPLAPVLLCIHAHILMCDLKSPACSCARSVQDKDSKKAVCSCVEILRISKLLSHS